MIDIPKEMLIKYRDDENLEECLINNVFPSLKDHAHLVEYTIERAIFATINDNVDMLNEKLIEMFLEKYRTYYNFNSVFDNSQNYYQEEFLNILTPNRLPPQNLVLKKNCLIMLLWNLDPSNGLCNGIRLVCKGFKSNVISVEIIMGQYVGKFLRIFF